MCECGWVFELLSVLPLPYLAIVTLILEPLIIVLSNIIMLLKASFLFQNLIKPNLFLFLLHLLEGMYESLTSLAFSENTFEARIEGMRDIINKNCEF